MLLVVAVIVGGILVGLGLGGSLRNIAEVRLRWWPLAVAGLVLQLIPVPSRPGQLDHWAAVGLLIGSYVVLLIFVAANLRLPGFPLIAVGFALNVLVIGLNGGMPVKDQALRQAAGSRYERSRQVLLQKGGLKHHLATPDDVLVPLSDVIGIGGPVRNVFSPGDLLSYAGVAWALGELTRRPIGKHRRGSGRQASVMRERAAVRVPPHRDRGAKRPVAEVVDLASRE
jgi:hypothetical protein